MRKNIIKSVGVTILASAMLMSTACNTKIKINYDYNASDYIELGEYKGIEVEIDKTSIENELIEKQIKSDLSDQTTYSEVSRGAIDGDKLLVTYTGNISGVAMSGLSDTSGYEMILGTDDFELDIDELYQALYGMTTEQTKVVVVTLPEDYSSTTYAGATVVFEITVQSVSQPNVPMITDAYVKEAFGYDTVALYREHVKQEVSDDVEDEVTDQIKEKVLTKLQENTTVKSLPDGLIDELTTKYDSSIGFYATYMNVSKDEYCQTQYGFSFDEYVRRAAIQQLIMQEIVVEEGYYVREYDYKGDLESFAQDNGYSSGTSFEDQFGKETIVKAMLTNKAQNLVIDSANVIYK